MKNDSSAWLGGPPGNFLLRHSLLPPRGSLGRPLRAETATTSPRTIPDRAERHPGSAAQQARNSTINNSSGSAIADPDKAMTQAYSPAHHAGKRGKYKVDETPASSRRRNRRRRGQRSQGGNKTGDESVASDAPSVQEDGSKSKYGFVGVDDHRPKVPHLQSGTGQEKDTSVRHQARLQ